MGRLERFCKSRSVTGVSKEAVAVFGGTVAKAAPAALNNWRAVRGARLFTLGLTLLHRFSIGLKSGE